MTDVFMALKWLMKGSAILLVALLLNTIFVGAISAVFAGTIGADLFAIVLFIISLIVIGGVSEFVNKRV